jgi:hypothetical protein
MSASTTRPEMATDEFMIVFRKSQGGRDAGYFSLMKNTHQSLTWPTLEAAVTHAMTLRGLERQVLRGRSVVAEWKRVRNRTTGKLEIRRIL